MLITAVIASTKEIFICKKSFKKYEIFQQSDVSMFCSYDNSKFTYHEKMQHCKTRWAPFLTKIPDLNSNGIKCEMN